MQVQIQSPYVIKNDQGYISFVRGINRPVVSPRIEDAYIYQTLKDAAIAISACAKFHPCLDIEHADGTPCDGERL